MTASFLGVAVGECDPNIMDCGHTHAVKILCLIAVAPASFFVQFGTNWEDEEGVCKASWPATLSSNPSSSINCKLEQELFLDWFPICEIVTEILSSREVMKTK